MRLQDIHPSILFEATKYDPPMSIKDIKKKGYSHLLKDPLHMWRAKTGIELIHKEPTLEELNRIWKNWQLMTPDMKRASDKKSKELFGMTNEEHYRKLLKEYNNKIEMTFPKDEWSDLKKRLKNKLPIITTRIEKEQGKYKVNQIVSTPLQPNPLKVIAIDTYKRIEDHPYYEHLTPSQRKQISNKVYDVIKLVSV